MRNLTKGKHYDSFIYCRNSCDGNKYHCYHHQHPQEIDNQKATAICQVEGC